MTLDAPKIVALPGFKVSVPMTSCNPSAIAVMVTVSFCCPIV